MVAISRMVLPVTRPLFLAVLVLLLAACAARPPVTDSPERLFEQRLARLAALEGWEASGRIGLRTPEESVALSMDWVQEGGDWRLNLRGPLAAGSMRLQGGPGEVSLRTSEGVRDTGPDARTLLVRHTGHDFPADVLRDWLMGIPSPDYDADLDLDAYGRPERIRQLGWDVEYQAYRGIGQLDMPMRMDLHGPGLRVRVVVSEWNLIQ